MASSRPLKHEIRRGTYFDSAVLMHLQRALAALPGVSDAGVVMGTKANLDLLAESGLLPPSLENVNPEDLVLVVLGVSGEDAEIALLQVDELMKRRSSPVSGAFLPRSLDTAVRTLPNARWVLVSVPGQYAAQVADEALGLGRHVFLYSDNVPLEDEIRLKQRAAGSGLLVMGPDCGTAVINGAGFGFANRVRRGSIGLVGASGTGLQALMVYIHALGGGVSQAIGTGGRDLHAEVGGITAAQGLEALTRDEQTRVIGIVSKPPSPVVVSRLERLARAAGKPVVIYYQGLAPPGDRLGTLFYASSLEGAARTAVAISEKKDFAHSRKDYRAGYLRGLFSGGTLAYEVLLMLQNSISPLYTNLPLKASQRLENPLDSQGHTILDLGADEFTVGRLHPMIDNDLRIRRLKQEAADPEVGFVLLDLVLGEGAHPDPASEFAPVIERIRGDRDLDVIVLVLATDDDFQNAAEQMEVLQGVGAAVYTQVSDAVEHVIDRTMAAVESVGLPVSLDSLQDPVAAINVGLESFYGSLRDQGVKSVHVDWRPPAGGSHQMLELLQKMKSGGASEPD